MDILSFSQDVYGADTGGTYSREFNFAPSNALAEISLSYVEGSGRLYAGIQQVRYRQTLSGPDIVVDFGPSYYNWDNHVPLQLMTSATFGILVAAQQRGRALINIFLP